MATLPITLWQADGETVLTMTDFLSWGSKINVDGDCSHGIKTLAPWKKRMKNLDRIFKSRDIILLTNVQIVKASQSYVFASSYVQMWELNHKKGWVLKNWCFRTVVLEETLESPLDSKEIKTVNPKGNQPSIFIGRTDAEDWCWERGRAGGEGMTGWDGWMASPIQWTWVWAKSGRWRRTGKPGMLQSMGSQRVGLDLVTKQQNPIVGRVYFPPHWF